MRKDFESNYNTGEGTGRRMKMLMNLIGAYGIKSNQDEGLEGVLMIRDGTL